MCIRDSTSEARHPSAEELADVRHMLEQRGVRRIPHSVMQEAQRRYGTLSQMPLTLVVQALRGQRGSVLRKHASVKTKGVSDNCGAVVTSPWQCTDDSGAFPAVCRIILQEHGYPEDRIREAIRRCGADVKRAVEFCLQMQEGAECEESLSAQRQQEISRQCMVDMGFPLEDIVRALELSLIHI